ncbi:MAG: DUF268 domain-containing protein [Acidimicrobiia bacterium]
MKRVVKWLLEPIAKVYRRFFDPRFEQLATRLEQAAERVNVTVANVASELDASGQARTEVLSVVGRELRRLEGVMEELRKLQAITEELRKLEGLTEAMEELRSESSAVDRRLSDVLETLTQDIGFSLEEMSQRTADLLNYAEGYRGPAGQGGLWFNPPVVVQHTAGRVEVGSVNERIIEIPFVFAQLSHTGPGARLLDVGSNESYLALQLSSLGYRATALDLHPYPFEHPNLTVVAQPLEQWEGPEEPFDVAICLSSIEHFGLGAYGEAPTAGRVDLKAMKQLRQWVRPGGLLVLTIPYGSAHVDSLQRVYDKKGLEELLEGWETRSSQFAAPIADGWSTVDDPDELETRENPGVALVVAVRPK